jgi:hypothetical protein
MVKCVSRIDHITCKKIWIKTASKYVAVYLLCITKLYADCFRCNAGSNICHSRSYFACFQMNLIYTGNTINTNYRVCFALFRPSSANILYPQSQPDLAICLQVNHNGFVVVCFLFCKYTFLIEYKRRHYLLKSPGDLPPRVSPFSVFFFFFLRRKAFQDKAMQRQTSTTNVTRRGKTPLSLTLSTRSVQLRASHPSPCPKMLCTLLESYAIRNYVRFATSDLSSDGLLSPDITPQHTSTANSLNTPFLHTYGTYIDVVQ